MTDVRSGQVAPALLDREPGAFAFGLWRNVVIAYWWQMADADRVQRFGAAVARVSHDLAGPRSNVHVIAGGAGLPTAEARAAFTGMMDAGAKRLACVAVVVEGEGFWSGAQRSAVTSMRQQSSAPIAHRIVGSTLEAAQWLAPEHAKRTGVIVSADDLHHAVEALRAP